MFTFRSAAVVLGLLMCLAPVDAWAQAATQAPLAANQTLDQELSAAPAPGQSGVSLSVGAQIQDGRTSTRGWSIDGIAAHTLAGGQLLRLDAAVHHGKYSGGPNEPLVEAENNQRVTATYLQRLRPRIYALGLAEWRRDAIIELDYRAAAEAGAAVGLIERPHLRLVAGAAFALGRESRGYRPDFEQVRDVGLRQHLVVRLGSSALFEQSFKAHVEVGNAEDKTRQFDVSLMSRVTSRAGMKVYYKYQYDALHPIDQLAAQHEMGVGVQYTFSTHAAPRP